MKEQVGPKALLERARKNLGPAAEQLPELPLLAYRVLDGMERQKLAIRWRSDELDRLREETRVYRSQMLAAASGGSLVLSGTLLLVLGPGAVVSVAVTKALAVACYLAGGFFLALSWR